MLGSAAAWTHTAGSRGRGVRIKRLTEVLAAALPSAGQPVECRGNKLCTNSHTLHAQVGCSAAPALQALQATPQTSLLLGVDPRLLALVGGLVLLASAVKKLLDTPSRTYNPDAPNVGDEYDNWTQCAPRCSTLCCTIA